MNEQMEELCDRLGVDFLRLQELLTNHGNLDLPLTIKPEECKVLMVALEIAGGL